MTCTAGVVELEQVAALGWRPLEAERLGGWLLRASGGFTGRANSALPLGDPGLPVAAAVDHVERWYDGRGLVPRFQVPLPGAEGVDAELDHRGWSYGDASHVLVGPVQRLTGTDGPTAAPAAGLTKRVDDRPDDSWLDAYHYRGGTLPALGRSVLEGGHCLGFASVRHDDRAVLAIARGAVDLAPDGMSWLGVTAVEVDAAARRRGLGRLVMAVLGRWAADQGAACCYLQVAVENAPALAMYTSLGLVVHHRYHYRLRSA